ncbi:MAG: toll/interleukin-1 receptor domain-containing protein [Aggregatilineales bacterium]
MSNSIFLSHSHDDKPFVHKLYLDLESRGIKAWLDEAEIGPGESLIAKIEKGIDEMDYLGVVLSPKSVESEWVLREVRMALTQEIAGRTIKVIPLVVENCTLPGFLLDKLFIDFRDQTERSYQKSLDILSHKVQGKPHEIQKSRRLKFIDSLQSVPDDARAFDPEFTKTNVLSLSRALNDGQFDALHDLGIKHEGYDHGGRGIVKSLAVERIGGDPWDATRTFDALLQAGFFSLPRDPQERNRSNPGYDYTALFRSYINLMRFLHVGELLHQGVPGSKWWLSSRNSPEFLEEDVEATRKQLAEMAVRFRESRNSTDSLPDIGFATGTRPRKSED